MDKSLFPEIKNTRFLAVNFTRLQGLRAVPVGLLQILIAYWANLQHGRANIILPIFLALICAGFYFLIDRYYAKTFGKVVATSERRRSDWILSIIAGIVGLAAFWLDNIHFLPVSLVGVAIACGILADYVRLLRHAQGLYAPFNILIVLLIITISILPVLGLNSWWLQIGFRVQLLAVFMMTGLLFTVNGFLGHLLFVRMLPGETNNV